MSMNLSGFDASQVEPSEEMAPIPEGEYEAAIVSSEEKTTRKGDGSYASLTFQIIGEGKYKNRKVWHNLNLNNPSDVAAGIARAELSAICRAVGVIKPLTTSELHDIPLVIKVACKKREDTGEMKNVIKAFKSTSEASKVPAAEAPGKPSMAWKK